MSKLTDFIKLLKGESNEYFDYVLYLNNNWDKIDKSMEVIYERNNSVYINGEEFNAIGDAFYKDEEGDWYVDSSFRRKAKDNYEAINEALLKARETKKTLVFPKGRYFISEPLDLFNLNIDIVFEKGAVLVGDVIITDTEDIAFKNLNIEGKLILDAIRYNFFSNVKVSGETKICTSIRGKDSAYNLFLQGEFKNKDNTFEFMFDSLVNDGNKKLKTYITNNTFVNCRFISENYCLYSNISEEIINTEVKNNVFINCEAISESDKPTIYLNKFTKSFHFIEQSIKGENSLDVENSIGQHIFSGGLIEGSTKGLDKFLIYKPTNTDTVSFDKIGNNINNMRKMKVFNNEVPKWNRFNVYVENDSKTLGYTGEYCLKIGIEKETASYPTLERVFDISDHLNQPINVIVRVKAKYTKLPSEAAVIVTNGNSNDTITLPIEPNNNWQVVTAKLEKTDNRRVTVKLSPNNSYRESDNELFIDWIIIALGDFAQFSSIPNEEHHYSDLNHYGNLDIIGNTSVLGELSIDGNLKLKQKILGDMNIDGNLSLLKNVNFGDSSDTFIELGNSNYDSVNNLSTYKYRIQVEGNEENQILKIYSVEYDNNSEKLEPLLELSKDKILYKGLEVHHSNSFGGAGADRPENPEIGRQFFDTMLEKPIWYTGIPGKEWVDAMGNKA